MVIDAAVFPILPTIAFISCEHIQRGMVLQTPYNVYRSNGREVNVSLVGALS